MVAVFCCFQTGLRETCGLAWEPDTPASFARRYSDSGDFSVDGLGDWELELDLRRLVFADSLTVVFPSGQFEEGQPLKSFAVLASMGERFPFPLGNNLKFSLVQQASTGFAAGKLAQGCVRSGMLRAKIQGPYILFGILG